MISADDRQTLASIEEGLAAAAPELAAMLATFARLNAGERMPTRERIRVRERADASRHGRRHQHRGRLAQGVNIVGLALIRGADERLAIVAFPQDHDHADELGGQFRSTDDLRVVCPPPAATSPAGVGAAGFLAVAVKAAARFPRPVCQGWLAPLRVLRGRGLVPGCFCQVSCHVMQLDMTALGHRDEQLEGLIS
jgi:hypothetical protein